MKKPCPVLELPCDLGPNNERVMRACIGCLSRTDEACYSVREGMETMSDTTTAPEYRIQKIEDFLSVPKDRLPACLEEFADFIETMRETVEFIHALQEVTGEAVSNVPCTFVWIDDGKKERSITFTVQEEGQP